jgi:hypothetical protein
MLKTAPVRYLSRALAVVSFIACLQGDTLQMRDGQIYRGSYLGGDAREMQFKTTDGRARRFSIDRVRSLTFGPDDQTPSAAMPRSKPDIYPKDRDYNDFPPNSSNANYPTGASVKLPVSALPPAPIGTTVVVRLTEPVDFRESGNGKTYDAVLAEPLSVKGVALVPRGAHAVVKVVAPRSLHLVQISSNGKRYSLVASNRPDEVDNQEQRLPAASSVVFILSQPFSMR